MMIPGSLPDFLHDLMYNCHASFLCFGTSIIYINIHKLDFFFVCFFFDVVFLSITFYCMSLHHPLALISVSSFLLLPTKPVIYTLYFFTPLSHHFSLEVHLTLPCLFCLPFLFLIALWISTASYGYRFPFFPCSFLSFFFLSSPPHTCPVPPSIRIYTTAGSKQEESRGDTWERRITPEERSQ